MTAGPSIDPEQFLHEQLAQASPDLMREMLETFINTLLSAQADSVCGAEYGTRSQARSNRRNGYRHRDLDTRVGTIDVAVPKLREGSFFPDWLLERRGRAGQAPPSGGGGPGPSRPSPRWWRPATCSGCRPGGWTSWSAPWVSPACRSRRCRRWPAI